MIDFENQKPADEAGIERVLRAAGGRDHPSEALERRVRAAVHAQWRAAVAQRSRRRRGIWLAAAASVTLAAVGLWLSRTPAERPSEVVASVNRADGAVSRREDSRISWLSGGRWQPVGARQSLRAGDALMTGPTGRAALTLANGISLRLDRDTRVAFVNAQHLEVRTGAVYVDAGVGEARPLRIDTPAGAVSHLGTQYEVRLLRPGVRIRVREGRVQLSHSSGVERVRAGEQLTVSAGGRHERLPVSTSDAGWRWVADLAPSFEIEGRSLRDFLAWVGRELGREIVFATPESEAEAARVMLHGSVAGLTPGAALEAVMPTTRLRSVQRKGQIVVELQ